MLIKKSHTHRNFRNRPRIEIMKPKCFFFYGQHGLRYSSRARTAFDDEDGVTPYHIATSVLQVW